MTEQEQKELLEKVKSEAKTVLENAQKGLITQEYFELKLAELNKQLEGFDVAELKETIKAQAQEIEKLKNFAPSPDASMTVKQQIEKWQKDNEGAIAAIKAGQRPTEGLPMLHIKAPITMQVNASLNNSPYLPRVGVAPGIIDLVRNRPTFWDYLPKGRTSLNPYVWVNKTNKQGNAEFIGEGVLKPLASFELETESSVPKKAAEAMKASTELLYDVDGMQSFIEDELRYEVMMAANTAVLTGTASSTSPAGITTLASGFALTTVETTNPNNADAIRAAIAQLITLNFNRNLVAFVNPIDAANMDLSKAVDSGVYILPPFTTADGRVIAGVPVIEDNNIAVGYLLIGDLSKYRILMYQDFFIQWGWENDDFRKNLMTVIGEMRFHQFMSANHVGAFIYDTFANIKTAIDAAV